MNKYSARKRGFAPIIRTVVLALVSVALITAMMAAYTFSWFMMNISAPGTSITTGSVHVKFKSYKADRVTAGQLVKYVDFEIDGTSSVEMYSGLQREIGVCAAADGSVDDVYFLVEKESDSVPLETYISFRVEGADGSEALSDYISGFNFRLENITAKLNAGASPATNVKTALNGAVNAGTANERMIKGYIDSAPANEGVLRSVAYISEDSGDNVASNMANGSNFVVYRLSTMLNLNAPDAASYAGISFRIAVTLSAGQVGTFSGSSHEEYLVGSMNDFNDVITELNPGDVVVLQDNVTYNGDLIFTVPVTLRTNGHNLTVQGNLVFTGVYAGEYGVDTSEGGILSVKKVGRFGGNFNIDASRSSCRFIGKGSPTEADITVEDTLQVRLSGPEAHRYDTAETDTGLTVAQARVVGSDGQLCTFLAENKTRIAVLENTSVGTIKADAGVEVISVINRGTVAALDFFAVEAKGDNSDYCMTEHMPQIFVDNFGTVGPVNLPEHAKTFAVSMEGDVLTCTGNTRLVCEFGAHYGELSSEDVSIESMDKNVVPNFDRTYLTVYYTHFDSTHPSVNETLRVIFEGNGTEDYPGFRNALLLTAEELDAYMSRITGIRVVTASDKNLIDDDYLYLRSAFPALQTLDLSSAEDDDGAVPAEAFKGLSELQDLSLPANTTSLGADFVYNTAVYDLRLPAGVTDAGLAANALRGVQYVHVTTDTPLGTLMNDTSRYIFVPTEQLNSYRGRYSAAKEYVFREATLSADRNYFYRITGTNIMDLAVWVGDTSNITPLTFDMLDPLGNTRNYYVASYDAYAFANKITGNRFSVNFSSKLSTIGDYAFYGCTSLTGITAESDMLSSVGYQAFAGCTNLTAATLDGKSGMYLSFASRPSYGTEGANSVFKGCINLTNLTLRHISEVDSVLLKPDGNPSGLEQLCVLEISDAGSIATDALHKLSESDDRGSSTLEKLTVHNVATVGDRAFKKCAALKTVYITGNQSIGDECFNACTSLVIASLPDTGTVGYSAFLDCAKLEAVSIPVATNYRVNGVMKTFYGCPELRLLETSVPATATGADMQFVDQNCLINFKVWLLHTEQMATTVFPDGIMPGATYIPDSSSILVNTDVSLDDGLPMENTGSLGAGDFRWASATDACDRIHAEYSSAILQTQYLSDFGLGDYLYSTTGSVSTVWANVIEEVVGTEKMPDVAPDGGTTEIHKNAFKYLNASKNYTATTGDRPIFVMPETVTYIGRNAFVNNKLFGVEGPGVERLGPRSFENSSQLRWAKFISCYFFEFYTTVDLWGDSINVCYTFYNSPKITILEVGVCDDSLRQDNTVGVLRDCSSIKYIVVHTETAKNEVTLNRNWLSAAFRNIDFAQQSPIPGYRVIISETSSEAANNHNYYSDYMASTTFNTRTISTGQYLGDTYRFASDSDSSIAAPESYVDGWHLSDIGYGDYLCVKEDDEVTLVKPLVSTGKIIGTESAYSYSTPAKTYDGLSITKIGSSAYANVTFVGSCGLIIPNSVTYIGGNAFIGASCLTSITLGESLSALGEQVFPSVTSSLESLTIKSTHGIPSSNLFGSSTLNENFTVNVYSSIYTSYYQRLGIWNGISTTATSGRHFAFLGDSCSNGVASFSFSTYGEDGYIITDIRMREGTTETVLVIPTEIPQATGSIDLSLTYDNYLPVLAIAANCFDSLSGVELTGIQFPYTLQSISDQNFRNVPPTVSFYTMPDDDGKYPVGNYRVSDGLLYGANGTVLVSCPPAKENLTRSIDASVISSYAFNGTAVTSVSFENNGTVLFMPNAFQNCNSLEAVTVCGSTQAVFSDNTFNGAPALTRLALENTEKLSLFASGNVFSNTSGCDIRVPSELYESYRQANVLNESIASRFRGN